MKAFKFVILGTGAAISLGVLLTQLYVWITMYGVVHSINEEMAKTEAAGTADATFAPGLEISGTDEDGHQKYGYVALTSMGKMHDYRVVSIESFVRLNDMLDKAETMPESELIPAFVTARAVRLAEAECELLKRTLAAECKVSFARASPEQNGLVDVSFSLNFIQRSEFGAIRAKQKAAYVEIEQSLIPGGTEKIVTLSGAPALRASLYERTVELCEKIRRSEGNCAISSVSIRASHNGGSVQSVYASATFATIESL